MPHAFVASKAISHGLPDAAATAPEGWCAELAQWLDARVLPGHSAFALDDARSAARRLLRDGAVRVKPGSGIGGRGQSVVRDEAEADAALSALDPTGLATLGVVLERNLVDAVTYSVGCLAIAWGGDSGVTALGQAYLTVLAVAVLALADLEFLGWRAPAARLAV